MNFFKKIFGGGVDQNQSNERDDSNKNKEIPAVKTDAQEKQTTSNELQKVEAIIKDIDKPKNHEVEKIIFEYGAAESIYNYCGINYDFINSLYFIDEAQKVSLLSFVKDAEEKFKVDEIDTRGKYDSFHSKIERFYSYADTYKSKYQNNDYRLSEFFPYFTFEDFYKWEIKQVSEIKRGVTVEKKIIGTTMLASTSDSKEAAKFNIINKTHNAVKEISKEETIIVEFLESQPKFRYYKIQDCINCLIDYYLNSKDSNKVEMYLNQLIDKTEDEDLHKVEDEFVSLLWKLQSIGEFSKAIDLGKKGVEFIKSQFPSPKNKSMGKIYKEYITLLISSNKLEEAQRFMDEASSYNEALKLSQLKSKLDKIRCS